jgi:plasmid stability protein
MNAESAIMIATEADMAQILVRNLEDQLKARLQRRAKRHGRSMEEEVREILRNSLREEEAPSRGLGSEMVALFSGQGIGLEEGEEIREIRGMRMQIPDFES